MGQGFNKHDISRDAAQLHRFWGWKRIEVSFDCPFSVKADDCSLSMTGSSWTVLSHRMCVVNTGNIK